MDDHSPECQGTSNYPTITEDSPVKMARRAHAYRFVGDIARVVYSLIAL